MSSKLQKKHFHKFNFFVSGLNFCVCWKYYGMTLNMFYNIDLKRNVIIFGQPDTRIWVWSKSAHFNFTAKSVSSYFFCTHGLMIQDNLFKFRTQVPLWTLLRLKFHFFLQKSYFGMFVTFSLLSNFSGLPSACFIYQFVNLYVLSVENTTHCVCA